MNARSAVNLSDLDLNAAKRIVVKIGSTLLVDEKKGAIKRAWLDALSDDLAALRAAGKEILSTLIVTCISGEARYQSKDIKILG